MLVLIQLAQLDKDGMDMDAFKFFALPILFTMEHSAFVQIQRINAILGNILMDFNVYISLKNAL